MKLHTALAVVMAALTVAVPVAVAAPDGYQPQLRPEVVVPDAFDRYLRNNAPQPQPDVNRAAGHPDSLGARPAIVAESETFTSDGRDWTAGAFGALGGAVLALLAIAGASTIRTRRRLVLR